MHAVRRRAAPDDPAGEYERVCAASDITPGSLRAATLRDGTRACVGGYDAPFGRLTVLDVRMAGDEIQVRPPRPAF